MDVNIKDRNGQKINWPENIQQDSRDTLYGNNEDNQAQTLKNASLVTPTKSDRDAPSNQMTKESGRNMIKSSIKHQAREVGEETKTADVVSLQSKYKVQPQINRNQIGV